MSTIMESWPRQESGIGEYNMIISLLHPHLNLGQFLLEMSDYVVLAS